VPTQNRAYGESTDARAAVKAGTPSAGSAPANNRKRGPRFGWLHSAQTHGGRHPQFFTLTGREPFALQAESGILRYQVG